MTKLFKCTNDQCSMPISNEADARVECDGMAFISKDGQIVYDADEYPAKDSIKQVGKEFTCIDCGSAVYLVEMECPHMWDGPSNGLNQVCRWCGLERKGRVIYDNAE